MTQLSLEGIWQLSTLQQDSKGTVLNAEVPGTILDTWIKAGTVPDPYYAENEKAITPLFDNDFEYSRIFPVNTQLLAEDQVDLVCLGIDTLAEIFINNKSVASVNNMHKSWRFNVKALLHEGENTVRIVIFSPNQFIAKAYREGPIDYINTGTMAGSNYLRKTHCQFGWDWGPMLPDAGIWRGIYLEGWSTACLSGVYVIQEHSNPPGEKVTLRVKVQAEAADLKKFWTQGRILTAKLKVMPPGIIASAKPIEANPVVISDITADAELVCVIDKPELWWPNGLGAQPLYNVEVGLFDADSLLGNWQRRIGLRTITVCAEKDQWGREFTQMVNGVKYFAMGADYIPEDSVFARINASRTRGLLESCVKANYNSIRVWGGGCYPADYFYDICDELGLVIWQDFMFACNIYELNDDFAANVAEEIKQNIIRIRHHACLGLWCGNNEMEEAWVGWDNVKCHSPALKADYIKLFEFLIPEIWKKTDPQTFYWPASPSSGGGFDAPNDPNHGDVHYWEVWHGLKPFSEYRKYLFRYCSEFGFQSLPDLETIQSFAKNEDLNLFSPVLEAHQRCIGGNGKILYYLSETYRYPKDFAALVYISQVLQMESIQSGVDHWRRHRGRCMGAIYWQLNDCWPVASWSGIDYYGRWKALHYGARRFFAPLRASIFVDETEAAPPGSLAGPLKRTVRVFVHNDTMQNAPGVLTLYVRDRDFAILAEETLNVDLTALNASEVLVKDCRKFIDTEKERLSFVTAELRIKKELASSETILFVPPKAFSFNKPVYNIDVKDNEGNFAITVKANTFCRFVRIKIPEEDVVFSDNYFDITGKEGITITVSKKELKKDYTAQTLKTVILENVCSSIVSVADSF